MFFLIKPTLTRPFWDSFTPPWRLNIFHHCNFFATFLLPTRGLFPSSPILPFEPFFDFFECRTCLNSPSIKPWNCFTWCLCGTLLTIDFFTFWIPFESLYYHGVAFSSMASTWNSSSCGPLGHDQSHHHHHHHGDDDDER